MQLLKNLFGLAMVVGAMAFCLNAIKLKTDTGPALYFPVLQPHEAHAYEQRAKRGDKLRRWIDELAQAESGGRADIVVLDTNKRYSYSCLQFQKLTWEAYKKKYGITGDIMDCQKQKQLAFAMLADDHGNWRHWTNSVKRIGSPPVVR